MDQIVFIDANIFLEIILKDKKSEECKKFLNKIISGEILGITSDFIVFTCLLQIQHKTKDLNKMKDFIIFINSIFSLKIMKSSLSNLMKTINFMQEYKLDFDDALVISCMKSNNINTLVSLDKDFDKVKSIKRIES